MNQFQDKVSFALDEYTSEPPVPSHRIPGGACFVKTSSYIPSFFMMIVVVIFIVVIIWVSSVFFSSATLHTKTPGMWRGRGPARCSSERRQSAQRHARSRDSQPMQSFTYRLCAL